MYLTLSLGSFDEVFGVKSNFPNLCSLCLNALLQNGMAPSFLAQQLQRLESLELHSNNWVLCENLHATNSLHCVCLHISTNVGNFPSDLPQLTDITIVAYPNSLLHFHNKWQMCFLFKQIYHTSSLPKLQTVHFKLLSKLFVSRRLLSDFTNFLAKQGVQCYVSRVRLRRA